MRWNNYKQISAMLSILAIHGGRDVTASHCETILLNETDANWEMC